jgi:uncharacterized protein (UPF0128 family)
MSVLTKQDLFDQYTDKREIPDSEEFSVHLVVDHQSFCVCHNAEDSAHADWFREQLAVALSRMLEQNGLQVVCEHSKSMTDYCEPCGRVNSG